MNEQNKFIELKIKEREERSIIMNLSETESLPKDGSLLMKWHQKDTVAGKKDKELNYATAMMPGYENVRNLSLEEAWGVFNYKNDGESGEQVMANHIDKSSPTLLLPLQAGRCPFDCLGCTFAASFPANKDKKIQQIGMEETRVLIKESLDEAQKKGIITSDIGISFVGSGDATPNPFLEEIFKMIMKEFPNVVRRVRFSTVAGSPKGGYSTPMQVVEKIINNPEYTGQPQISMQVSAHHTNIKRVQHVFSQRIEKSASDPIAVAEKLQKLLLPLPEVAQQFQQIVDAQKERGFEPIRKPTLTFVCTKDTEIDVEALANYGFNKENTVIQLRPILSEDPKDCMSEEVFSSLYNKLGFAGYDVVLMPVSPSGVELETG